MQISSNKSENVRNGKSVIAWVVLLFVLTLVGAPPLITGGLNLNDLPQSSPLLPLVFLASCLRRMRRPSPLSSSQPGPVVPARQLLRQAGTWRVGVG